MARNIHALALALLVAFAGLFGAVGAVSAQDAGNTTLENSTVAVSEDTRSILLTAQNATDSLDVSISGIDNGTETEVGEASLDATSNTTDSYEYSQVDASTYGEYRVLVEGPDGAAAETINVEKVEVVPGGGGFLGGSGSPSMVVILGAVLVGGYVYVSRQ